MFVISEQWSIEVYSCSSILADEHNQGPVIRDAVVACFVVDLGFEPMVVIIEMLGTARKHIVHRHIHASHGPKSFL